jgi:tetratricopeptide (TPR) repeat protein
MGECWQKLKQYAKAIKCYQFAIQKSTDLDGDRQKMALYRGAVLATALKQADQARQWLTQLVQLDPHFKDAASRLDKLG